MNNPFSGPSVHYRGREGLAVGADLAAGDWPLVTGKNDRPRPL